MKKGHNLCRFYFEGKHLTELAWHTVPNEGEIVMLRRRPAGPDEKLDQKLHPFKVVGRIFMEFGAPHNMQLIYLYVENKEQTDDAGTGG